MAEAHNPVDGDWLEGNEPASEPAAAMFTRGELSWEVDWKKASQLVRPLYMDSIEVSQPEGDAHGGASGIDGRRLVAEIQNVSS